MYSLEFDDEIAPLWEDYKGQCMDACIRFEGEFARLKNANDVVPSNDTMYTFDDGCVRLCSSDYAVDDTNPFKGFFADNVRLVFKMDENGHVYFSGYSMNIGLFTFEEKVLIILMLPILCAWAWMVNAWFLPY